MDLYAQIQALRDQVLQLQAAKIDVSNAAAAVIVAKKAEQAAADSDALMYSRVAEDLNNALALLPAPIVPEPEPEPVAAVS
jgi:hypothetical protein